MANVKTIAGLSIASIAAIISLCCFVWILLHIGTKYDWWGSKYYRDWKWLQGGGEIF